MLLVKHLGPVKPFNALLEALEGTDTQLEAVRERIDRSFFVLMAWFGGIELENFRDRAMMGKRGRAKGGMIPCRQICFGYDVDEDGFPVLNEKAAETVRYIFKLYVEEGLGMIKLTRRLNSEGIPAAKGGRWGYVIHSILAHPAYLGTWYYGVERWEYLGKKKVKKTIQPEDEWIRVKVPQIIDEITWHRAQQLKKERSKQSKRNTRVFYLLQHIMYCEPCGRMMGCRTDRRKRIRLNGKVYRVRTENPEHIYRVYLCHGQQRDKYNCRQPGSIDAQALEDAVWSATERIIKVASSLSSMSDNSEVRRTTMVKESMDLLELLRKRGVIDEITWHRAQQLKTVRTQQAVQAQHASLLSLATYNVLRALWSNASTDRWTEEGCRTDRRKRIRLNGKVYRVRTENPEHIYRVYLCHGQQRDKYNCRQPGSIDAQALEDAVWSATERIIKNPQEFLSNLEAQSIDDDKLNSLPAEIRRVRHTLDKENAAKTFVIRMGSLGRLTEEEFDEQLEIIREKVEHNEELLADLLGQENMAKMQEDHKEHIKAYLSSIDQVIGDLTDTQRRELIRLLYTRISIDGQNRITLTVALPGDPSTAIGI